MYISLLFGAAFLAASAAAAQQPPAPAPAEGSADPAVAFGMRDNVEHLDISPDGRRVVFVQPGPGRTTVVSTYELGSSAEPRVVIRTDGNPERMQWCNFVTNDRLVCQVTAMTGAAGRLIPFGRLISMDLDGSNPALLGERSSFYDAALRQFDAAIVDYSGGETGSVLIARDYVPEQGRMGTRLARTTEGLAVDRVNVRTLRTSRVEAPNRRASGYISDGRGNIRIMRTFALRGATGQVSDEADFFYRVGGSRDWRPFSTFNTTTGEGTYPLAIDPTVNAAYALRKLNGRFALYRIKLDGTMATELVHASDQVDVDGVIRASRGERVIGVTFADEQRRIVYFDAAYAALARTLGRAMPTRPQIDFSTASSDGSRILVRAAADNDPGRYYVYERSTRQLNEILLARPALENVALANVRHVTYPAADGVNVPAYLTLPPGREARGLPVVILPHGGPSARDEGGFDWLAQFLATRGYAVLQANYRGSAGYGDQWLQQNGFRSWRISIGDINAGARWLAAQGIGDPRRMAILGWSYGGYAALQSGATEPSLFKAIVAIAPVTDLQQAKDDFRNYTSARNVAEFIGEGPHIRDGSPLRNVAAITAPVLLFHGDRDLNVGIVHSRRMDSALREAGKRSELVVFEGLEHDLADSAARGRMLQRIDEFLTASLRP